MRSRWVYGAMATISLMLVETASSVAQVPTPTNYNSERAQRHFAASRYSYRTLYSTVPGSGSVTYSPFLNQSQFVEPGYNRQRITPFGYERFDAIPGLGGTTITPFGVNGYYVPGFGYGYYAPNRGQATERYYR